MKDRRFRHIGGAIVSDCGAIPIAAARTLCRLYQKQGEMHARADAEGERYNTQVRSLDRVITEAAIWRRAAGWSDPEAADHLNTL